VSNQPAKHQSAIQKAKGAALNQIRLNDLIANKDVKAGRRTVFGAKPQKPQQNKPNA
jgi:hypothetical protein